MIRSRKRKLAFFCMVMMGLLVLLAVFPNAWFAPFLNTEAFFTAAHLIAYYILAFFLCLALRFQRQLYSIRMTNGKIVWIVLVVTTALGGLTEGMQHFVADRAATWFDFCCNLAGIHAGIFTYLLMKKISGLLRSKEILGAVNISPHV